MNQPIRHQLLSYFHPALSSRPRRCAKKLDQTPWSMPANQGLRIPNLDAVVGAAHPLSGPCFSGAVLGHFGGEPLLKCCGLGRTDLVWLRLSGWIEVSSPGEQIAAEGGDSDGGDHYSPGSEEEPRGIGEKRITESHEIDPSSSFCFGLEASRASSLKSPLTSVFRPRYCAGGGGGA